MSERIYFRVVCGMCGLLGVLLFCPARATPEALPATPVAVRHIEGLVHGFLVMRTTEGDIIAEGDLAQTVHGDQVTSHLVFHFKDGSLQDETTVFSQRKSFRLLSDHLIQKGPAFNTPMDLTVDGVTGDVTVRYADDDGKPKESTERLNLPANLANGMVPILLKNVPNGDTQLMLSMVVATPKPRLVKLAISVAGEDGFSVGATGYKATHYILKIDLGGLAGVVAPIVGKQPQDSHVWIMGGKAPAFIKSEGPQFEGGASWRIELASPTWP
jgi:hypothetical protein